MCVLYPQDLFLRNHATLGSLIVLVRKELGAAERRWRKSRDLDNYLLSAFSTTVIAAKKAFYKEKVVMFLCPVLRSWYLFTDGYLTYFHILIYVPSFILFILVWSVCYGLHFKPCITYSHTHTHARTHTCTNKAHQWDDTSCFPQVRLLRQTTAIL